MNKLFLYQILRKITISIICFQIGLLFSFAQNTEKKIIYGTIVGTDNLPVSGAIIFIKDFSSTFSDETGNFNLEVPSYNATIECEAKGYEYTQIALKGKKEIKIKLHPEGYKSQNIRISQPFKQIPQKNSAYSTEFITTENNKYNSAESFDNYLQGKISGLNVTKRSGNLGVGSSIILRGYNSLLLNSQPLIIIDGLMFDYSDIGEPLIKNSFQNLLTSIDIKDIESITVIKDALSTYGSKASNGIIYITTKHTNSPTTKISFNTYSGINYMPEIYPVMNGISFKSYLYEQLISSGKSNEDIYSTREFSVDSTETIYNYNNNTNWQNNIFKNGISQNYYLSVNGGDDVAKYNLSIGYYNTDGIIRNTNLSRFNTRFNSDIFFSSKFLVNVNLGFAVINRNIFDDGMTSNLSPLKLSLVKGPHTYPYLRSSTGEISSVFSPADYYSNPVALINQADFINKNVNFISSIKFNYSFTQNIKLHSIIGLNYAKVLDDIFKPENGLLPDTTYTVIERSSLKRANRFNSVYNETRLNYIKLIGGTHEIDVNVGFRLQNNNLRENWLRGDNSANDYNRALNYGVIELAKTGGALGINNWMSIFADINYNLFKKYFISVAISSDGSSKYGNNAKGINLFGTTFGLFPAFGGAWLISSEKFMENIDFINMLKIRASYGITGNDGLGNYWNKRLYSYSNSLYGQRVITLGSIENNEIKWETNKKLNGGIDIALFNDKLNASIDLYKNTIKDMLMKIYLPYYSGYSYYYSNIGSMENKGIELSVYSRIIDKKIKWDIGFNFAKNKNTIIDIPNNSILTEINGIYILNEEGKPAGLFKGYKTDKNVVFATKQEAEDAGLYIINKNGTKSYFQAGDIHFADLDNNKEINEKDMDIIGDPNPKFTGGFTTSISWKGLSLEALFTYTYGNQIYNYQRAMLESMKDFSNQTEAINNRWRSEGKITSIPKAVYGDPMGNSRFSDRWIEDGSYIKLKTLTVSYKFNIGKEIQRSLTIFATGNNLYTFTNYMGYDPEFNQTSVPVGLGVDYGLVPNNKSIIIGLNLEL
jgi:TonB-linked SusC/RagA family outer membrane protein